jgi:hypothetical protein
MEIIWKRKYLKDKMKDLERVREKHGQKLG